MRHTSSRSSFQPSILLLSVTVMTVGCIDGTIPLPLTLPAMQVDLDAPRLALEARVCRNEAAFDCSVLADLDATDGARERPFSLPELMPTKLRTSPSTIIDIPTWFADVQQRANDGTLDALIEAEVDGDVVDEGTIGDVVDAVVVDGAPWLPRQLLPLEIDAGALERLTPQQIAALTIQRAEVVVNDNSLSVDLPVIEIWVGNGLVDAADGTIVPADRSRARHIASSAAVAANNDGVATIEFAAGAVAALIEALGADEPWIELVAADDALSLLAGDRADTLRRPGGAATLTVDLQLGIPVSVGTLMELGSTGTEGLDNL